MVCQDNNIFRHLHAVVFGNIGFKCNTGIIIFGIWTHLGIILHIRVLIFTICMMKNFKQSVLPLNLEIVLCSSK